MKKKCLNKITVGREIQKKNTKLRKENGNNSNGLIV